MIKIHRILGILRFFHQRNKPNEPETIFQRNFHRYVCAIRKKVTIVSGPRETLRLVIFSHSFPKSALTPISERNSESNSTGNRNEVLRDFRNLFSLDFYSFQDAFSLFFLEKNRRMNFKFGDKLAMIFHSILNRAETYTLWNFVFLVQMSFSSCGHGHGNWRATTLRTFSCVFSCVCLCLIWTCILRARTTRGSRHRARE